MIIISSICTAHRAGGGGRRRGRRKEVALKIHVFYSITCPGVKSTHVVPALPQFDQQRIHKTEAVQPAHCGFIFGRRRLSFSLGGFLCP